MSFSDMYSMVLIAIQESILLRFIAVTLFLTAIVYPSLPKSRGRF